MAGEIILQGILQHELNNNYIVRLSAIGMVLHLLILSRKTMCITRASSVSIITLRNEKKQGSFDILHDISENFTLVQLMESVCNVNNAVSIVGYGIFDSNHQTEFSLTLYSINIIFST